MHDGSKSYFDYRLRLQVASDSADRLLLEYIKHEQHLTYSEKEMVLAALRMCWLPSAYQHHFNQTNGITAEDLRQVGLDAILRLKEQIQYIAAVTGVERWQERSDERCDERAYPMTAKPAVVAAIAPRPINPPSSPSFSSSTHTFAKQPTSPPQEDGYDLDLFGD